MAKMCEVIQDSWPMVKTGGRGQARHLSSSAELQGDPRWTDQCRSLSMLALLRMSAEQIISTV